MTDTNPSAYNAEFFAAWEKFADEIVLVFQAASADLELRPIATAQSRYVLANMALAQLMKSIGQRDIADRFHFLAEALQDLVEGTPHPLFKIEATESRRGRNPDVSAVWRIRANICIGIVFLMAGGMTEDNAIQHVAKTYKEALTKLLRPGADLKSSIKTWLKSFANDEIRNDVALSVYKTGMEQLEVFKSETTPNRILNVGVHLIEGAAEDAAEFVQI